MSKMENGIYFEVFAIKDGIRYNAKIVDMNTVSKILANSVMDGLGAIIGFKNDTPDQKGGE